MAYDDEKKENNEPPVAKYHEALQERLASEAAVGKGIKEIADYAEYVSSVFKRITPDVQGIITTRLNPEEVAKYKEFFPNGLKNGITVHFYQPGYMRHPPLTYMLNQKVSSLCEAAKVCFGIDIEKKMQAHVLAMRDEDFKDFNGLDLYRAEKEKIFHERSQQLMQETVAYVSQALYNTYLKKNFKEKKLSRADFLEKIRKQSEIQRNDKSDILIINQENNRFSYEALAYFPTERVLDDNSEPVTAHNKRIGQRAANLSMMYEGSFVKTTSLLAPLPELDFKQEEKLFLEGGVFAVAPPSEEEEKKPQDKLAPSSPLRAEQKFTPVVTSSLIKHASLAPDHDLVSWRIWDPYESNLHCLVKACNDIEDIVMAEARMRQHGRTPEEANKPMHIDWGYQLLTTNFWNVDKQATNYGYAVKAVQCMNGVTLTQGGMSIKTDIHLFNAGVNKWAWWNLFQKKDTQRIENRKAYIQMTEVLRNRSKIFEEEITKQKLENPTLVTLKKLLLGENLQVAPPLFAHAKYEDYLREYETIQKALAANADLFNRARKEYNEHYQRLERDVQFLEESYKKEKQNKNPLLTVIAGQLFKAKAEKANLLNQLQAYLSYSKRKHAELREVTRKMEAIQVKNWHKNKENINKLVKDLRELGPDMIPQIMNLSREDLLTLTGLVYKSYMDDLYYSGKYRDPQYAALFNGYMAAFQRAVGMMPTVGCKSANDRTFVVRLFYTALQQEPGLYPQIPELPAIPRNFHETSSSQDALIAGMRDNVMTHAGLHACIADTGGGAPKVDSKKFHYFKVIKDVVDALSRFGKFAAHLLKIDRLFKSLVEPSHSVHSFHKKSPKPPIGPSEHRSRGSKPSHK